MDDDRRNVFQRLTIYPKSAAAVTAYAPTSPAPTFGRPEKTATVRAAKCGLKMSRTDGACRGAGDFDEFVLGGNTRYKKKEDTRRPQRQEVVAVLGLEEGCPGRFKQSNCFGQEHSANSLHRSFTFTLIDTWSCATGC